MYIYMYIYYIYRLFCDATHVLRPHDSRVVIVPIPRIGEDKH